MLKFERVGEREDLTLWPDVAYVTTVASSVAGEGGAGERQGKNNRKSRCTPPCTVSLFAVTWGNGETTGEDTEASGQSLVHLML